MCVCGKSCKGLCDAAIGGRLVEFLNNNLDRIVTTELGTLVPKSEGLREYYTITGNQYYSLDPKVGTTRVMKDSEKVQRISRDNIFEQGQFDLLRLIKEYTNIKKLDNHSLNRLITGMCEYKKVLILVEPGKQLDVNLTFTEDVENGGKVYFKRATVASVKWGVDEKGKFRCTLACQADNDKSKVYRIGIEEYGKNFVSKSILDMSSDNKATSLVKMHHYGYIQPIVIKGKTENIIIDNVSIYREDSAGCEEIGQWNSNRLTGLNSITETEILKLITGYKDYIALHRKMIAPYTVGIANRVEVDNLN